MRKALLVILSFVFLVMYGQVCAQNFDTVKSDPTDKKVGISEIQARETMDKLADQDKAKLAVFMKQEKKSYTSVTYVNAKQALEMVNKLGVEKILVDKSFIRVNQTPVPSYVLIIPE